MKKSRFSEEQIVGILRQAEQGLPVKELCRTHGFSEATFYNWRTRYGGLERSEVSRLRELESENGKLKKLLGEAHLHIEALGERMTQIAWQRRRFGYRRIHDLLVREGWQVNHKRVWRLYSQAGLSVAVATQGKAQQMQYSL